MDPCHQGKSILNIENQLKIITGTPLNLRMAHICAHFTRKYQFKLVHKVAKYAEFMFILHFFILIDANNCEIRTLLVSKRCFYFCMLIRRWEFALVLVYALDTPFTMVLTQIKLIPTL